MEIQDKEARSDAKKLVILLVVDLACLLTHQLQIPPYEREIYVITMIKIKINDHCNSINGADAAAAPAAGAAA